jgi:site-specific recombinase XerD
MNLEDFFAIHTWSKNTIDRYRRALTKFLDAYPDPSPEKLSAGQLREWLETQPGWGSTSKNVALNAIRNFLRWQYGEEHPALRCRVRIVPPAPQRAVTPSQIENLLSAFEGRPTGVRDRAILGVFVDTGARVAEVAGMEMRNLDLGERKIKFLQKGARWRTGMFSPVTREWLRHWLDERSSIAVANGRRYLFVSLAANSRRGHPLSTDGLQVIVRRWGDWAGFKVSPHDFRRGFAVMSTRNGAPQNVAMVAGGWEDERTFRRYVQSLQVEDIDPYLPTRRWEK